MPLANLSARRLIARLEQAEGVAIADALPQAAAPNPKPPNAQPPTATFQLHSSESELSPEEARATVATMPAGQAACTMAAFTNGEFGAIPLHLLSQKLNQQIDKLRGGDLSRAEELLFSQASTLDVIFNALARRASANLAGSGEHLKYADQYLRLALKAQSQSRLAIETLGLLKNPVVFARQANIAHGPQQVNNGSVPATEAPRARETKSKISRNGLLEHGNGERLDPITPSCPVGSDQAMATVGTLDRSPHGERQAEEQH
jgi:hypothetical protein